MGVTVHFEGKLRGEKALADLLRCAEGIAEAKTWLTERVENDEATLLRVWDDGKAWDYKGPTRGIILYIHEDCDPVRFEFDLELYVQEFVKTQFAGVPAHLELIKLLKDLREFFEVLKVEDEGEYWETEDEDLLAGHMRRCDEAIADVSRKNPSARVKVRDPDGRFMDLLE